MNLLSQWREAKARHPQLTQVLMAAVLSVLVLLLVVPALRVWWSHEDRQAQLDATSRSMFEMRAAARLIEGVPQAAPPQPALQVEQAARRMLGPDTQIKRSGERLELSFSNVSADAMAQWLAHLRSPARARVEQAQMDRSQAAASAPGDAPAGHWTGTMTISTTPTGAATSVATR